MKQGKIEGGWCVDGERKVVKPLLNSNHEAVYFGSSDVIPATTAISQQLEQMRQARAHPCHSMRHPLRFSSACRAHSAQQVYSSA
jgi:hypothetical protein